MNAWAMPMANYRDWIANERMMDELKADIYTLLLGCDNLSDGTVILVIWPWYRIDAPKTLISL